MKREITPTPKPRKSLLAVYRTAVILVLVLVGILVAGSLYALVRPADSGPIFYLGRSRELHVGNPAGRWNYDDPFNVFSGIGRLRIPLAGQTPATVLLSVSFTYPADDQFFAEELATRVGDFRSIAVGYFGALSRAEIVGMDENLAKREILAMYNALLHLGRIETLYFTDLLILD